MRGLLHLSTTSLWGVVRTVGVAALLREAPTNYVLSKKVVGMSKTRSWNGERGIPNKTSCSFVPNSLAIQHRTEGATLAIPSTIVPSPLIAGIGASGSVIVKYVGPQTELFPNEVGVGAVNASG